MFGPCEEIITTAQVGPEVGIGLLEVWMWVHHNHIFKQVFQLAAQAIQSSCRAWRFLSTARGCTAINRVYGSFVDRVFP